MKNNTQEYYVSHSEQEGYQLILSRGSTFRNAVMTAADWACSITFHRFCSRLSRDPAVWDHRMREEILALPITEEQAAALSRRGVGGIG